jgi:hypothetical protein
MKPADQKLLVAALEAAAVQRLPPNWRIVVLDRGSPRGVMLVPPTGQTRYGKPLPWTGPGARPKGLELCRITSTADPGRRWRFAHGRLVPYKTRTILSVGLPGDRPMRCLGRGYAGRGWAKAMAATMIDAAWHIHGGLKPAAPVPA